MILTGVGGTFCAAHRLPGDVLGKDEIHGHSYEVTAWFRNNSRNDARCYQAALKALLSSWDHKMLPDELSWGEDLATAIGCLANCVEVEVARPLERFYARWKADR